MTVFKIIELEDQACHSHDYPYILSCRSRVRFRLRSKLCLDCTPLILIEKLESFQYLLPLRQPLDLDSPTTQRNFRLVWGQLTREGAWEADLPECQPGVISFQLVFIDKDGKMTNNFGTYDSIILCQCKFDLRKLRSMTIFPRCIGPVSKWPDFFRRQIGLGYNTFHLAPIQQTGQSNSYYSLKNHLQLSDDLFKGTQEQKNTQLIKFLEPLQKEGIAFIVDIVLNHTSFDSEWIQSEPDAVYTVDNTPMLYTAFLVDQVICQWGNQVKQMMAADLELKQEILEQIQENLTERLKNLDIYEYFQLEADLKDKMLALLPTSKPSENIFAKDPIDSIRQFFQSNCTTPNKNRKGITINNFENWSQLDIHYLQSDLKIAIEGFNQKWKNKIEKQWIPEIISSTISNVRYHYLEGKDRSFDDKFSLVQRYFSLVTGPKGQFYALNNGWVGSHDTRKLFITSQEYHYLRRRVNVWGDLIRIRYGQKPSDSPAAWEHMLAYVREMAKYFDGFRLDNLHGTPIYLARHMIREARKVKPNLIVFAELFTSNEQETAEFVKQIGINSTLKEVQHVLSGSAVVDAFHRRIDRANSYLGTMNRYFIENGETVKYAYHKRPISMVCDLTHDNQTYITKKIINLQTPVAILITFLGAFTGTTKGFDQFFSKKVDVTEMRQLYSQSYSYPPVHDRSELQPFLIQYKGKEQCQIFGSWNNWKEPHKMELDKPTNTYFTTVYVTPGKYEFKFSQKKDWILEEGREHNGNNHILTVENHEHQHIFYRNLEPVRQYISKKADKFFSFRQYHVYNIGDIVVVFRQPDNNLEGICIIANMSQNAASLPSEIQLHGTIIDSDVWVQSDLSVYQGLTTQTEIGYSKHIYEYFDVRVNQENGNHVLRAPFLPAGFACFIHCTKNQFHSSTITSLDDILARQIPLPKLGPLEVNSLFFNCHQEEEHLNGHSNYVIPQDNNRQLVYAGFAGVFNTIQRVKRTCNLNEGLLANLRQGNWLMDYYLNRCRRHKYLGSFTQYLEKVFGMIGLLPRYLVPKYFTELMYKIMITVKNQTKRATDFQKNLVFSSCQFINYFPSCPLPDKSLLAAGLPHFAVGWSRSWGRDTFISSDLLRLFPNIFREVILQFASAMRHGLIPNLLDQGRRPRYNCRDACWWFIRAIAQYIDQTKDFQILKNKVTMLFLSNDKFEHQKLQSQGKTKIMLLEDIVHEIFQTHALGISFRQWNAGYQIDMNMSSDGFNIQLDVDGDTGFIIGGNQGNCLTWMDKMGSSTHAGTKGIPATPRAGTPVELVGLLYCCLRSFQALVNLGKYSHGSVHFQGMEIELGKWAEKISLNFDNQFFLRDQPSQGGYVKGIYKDVVNSPIPYEQVRFRPNALITLAVAPQLCEPHHAKTYLKKVEQHLIRPQSIGIGTLSQNHSFYLPFYDNSNDSSDAKVAHGYSYHNGPEWVWLYGFYLTAKINFDGGKLTKRKVMTLLQEHVKHIQKSQWQSLTELTNKNGQYNKFSCPAQAWSISSILMVLRKIETLPYE